MSYKFNQRVHPKTVCVTVQVVKLSVIQTFGDQQHAVGTSDTRFRNLITVDDEFFPHHRNANDLADVMQIVQMPLKEVFVGQHAQAGRAGHFVLAEQSRPDRKSARMSPG
jgi:hypothetical protein